MNCLIKTTAVLFLGLAIQDQISCSDAHNKHENATESSSVKPMTTSSSSVKPMTTSSLESGCAKIPSHVSKRNSKQRTKIYSQSTKSSSNKARDVTSTTATCDSSSRSLSNQSNYVKKADSTKVKRRSSSHCTSEGSSCRKKSNSVESSSKKDRPSSSTDKVRTEEEADSPTKPTIFWDVVTNVAEGNGTGDVKAKGFDEKLLEQKLYKCHVEKEEERSELPFSKLPTKDGYNDTSVESTIAFELRSCKEACLGVRENYAGAINMGKLPVDGISTLSIREKDYVRDVRDLKEDIILVDFRYLRKDPIYLTTCRCPLSPNIFDIKKFVWMMRSTQYDHFYLFVKIGKDYFVKDIFQYQYDYIGRGNAEIIITVKNISEWESDIY